MRLPACMPLQGRPQGLCCQTHPHKHILTHAYTLLAQVATKVVAQNARLAVAPVEQVRQHMVAGRRAFNYSHFVQGYVPGGIRYSDGGMLAHRYGPIEPLAAFLTPTVMLARMSCESQTPPSARPWRRSSTGSRTCTASRCRPCHRCLPTLRFRAAWSSGVFALQLQRDHFHGGEPFEV